MARRMVRIVLGGVVVVCLALVAGSFVTEPTAAGQQNQSREPATPTRTHRQNTTGTDRNLTVITSQGPFYQSKVFGNPLPDNDPRRRDRNGQQPAQGDTSRHGRLRAVTANGSVVYSQQRLTSYFDVDPVTADAYAFESVPAGRYTVEYVGSQVLRGRQCPSDVPRCTRNVVERVNLTTGNQTTVYETITPEVDGTRYHDVDRLNSTHLVVADIYRERVFIVNTRTQATTWQWNVSDTFNTSTKSDEPHLNDVEVLQDGRFMVSLRNLDQVVFVSPGAGVLANQTLGTDQSHDIIYEQHNPDYIRSETGPRVVIADSENNRLVAYQRSNGTWTQTWRWRDATLQWPRDADRLPNGNTLVVDTHGERVLELSDHGRIVWQVSAIKLPYDAERLGTGDESVQAIRTTQSAAASTEPNHSPDATGPAGRVVLGVKSLLPSPLVNGALFIAPPWLSFTDLLFTLISLLAALCWGGLELYWWRFQAAVRSR